ncbi:hypothetical protein [Halomicrococcus sp. NG-SE-24]|uniref:hypothetical protein n=1 Tax=Halomicrococcus sp. NG-SE-24 TaxID=3436928 RepID=UPI003D9A0655
MGTDKDNPTATLYGNFKCPYTQEFVRGGNLEAVLNEYVTSGDFNLRFRALVYQPPGTSSHGSDYYYISDSDPLISQAALGVWDVSPRITGVSSITCSRTSSPGTSHTGKWKRRCRRPASTTAAPSSIEQTLAGTAMT